MRKNIKFVIYLFAFSIFSGLANSATLKLEASTAPPVELEKGWNLISVPCDIDTSLLIKGGGEGERQLLKKEDGGDDAEQVDKGNGAQEDDKEKDNGKGDAGNNGVENDNGAVNNGGSSENGNVDSKGNNGKNNGSGSDDNGNSGKSENENAAGGDKGGNGNDKETIFYGWNGEGYEEVTYLYRGVGYIVNTNNIQNTSSACKNGNSAEPMEMTLEKGWNLVGNPYHKSYKVEDVFGAAYSSITVIYEYSGNKYSALKASEHFKPWRGYWVYVEADVEVPVFISCALKISALKDQINVGDSSVVDAVYSCETATGEKEEYDVAEDAEWQNSNPDAGVVDKGIFTGLSDGSADIKAKYKNLQSNVVTIQVQLIFQCDKVVVAQVYDEEANSDGFCGEYSYFYRAMIHVGDNSVSLGDNQCRKCGSGAIMCRSNFFPRNKDVQNTILWNRANATIPLKAYCVSANEFEKSDPGPGNTGDDIYRIFKDVTAEADWKVRDSRSVLRDIPDTGLMLSRTDYAFAHAIYDGKSSTVQTVVVFDTEQVVKLAFQHPSIEIGMNDSKENRLIATFIDPSGSSEMNRGGAAGYLKTEDVTDRSEFTTAASYVSYENGVLKAKDKAGYAQIAGKFKDKTANMDIKILDPNRLLSIVFFPSYIDMFVGGELEARLYGMYYNLSNECKSQIEEIYNCVYRFEDITDKATFRYNNKLISYEDGAVKSLGMTGMTTIYAEYEGKYEDLPVEIISDDLVLVTIKGPEKKKMPECPASGCYATYVDEPIKLQVFAVTSDFTTMIEITNKVTWEVSDQSKGAIDAAGKLTPAAGGMIWVRATYKDARSDKAWIAISDKETQRFLIAGTGSTRLRPLQTGTSMHVYSALYEVRKNEPYNPVKFIGYVDADGYQISDDNLVSTMTLKQCWGATECLKVTGSAPGFVEMYTKYQGLESNHLDFEVWRYETINRCDASNPNTMVWSDYWGAQAVLDTDCYSYEQDEEVKVQYTAKIAGGTEMFFDNCLDLWILDENDNIVKTFRNEGCSSESIGRSAHKSVETVFQVAYGWDQIGDDGKKVAPGAYYATARFYILYEPVMHLPFEIKK